MTKFLGIFYLLAMIGLLLTACGDGPPPLAEANKPTLVYIYTEGWPPWKQMTPIVDGIEEQYGEQVVLKRINADVDDGPAIVEAYRIPGHPTTLLFDNEGNEVQRLFGPQPTEIVEQAVQEILP